eukprot:TRINITY_DN12683_c0_g1_i3.p1 TRINITY_DN12683_c0_g1~~TRINITY_DN12683_c0_g1_i3.p1  ORF type:complete len:491 (-),score=97.72 TRINITY_DN12683_c0_g1_i3:111-1523(-)
MCIRDSAKENILHRDLKPSNILIHEGVIKVADFGFCKAMKGPLDLTQTMVGSPIYMAPEILKGHSYSTKADMWSLGVVFYELLFGVCPFEEKSIQRLLVLIETRGLVFSKTNQISQKVEDMLRSMLVADPSKRIDWQSLLANYGDLGLDTTSKPQQQPFHQTTPNFTIGQTGTAPPTNSGTSVNFNPSSVVPPPTSATSYALSRKNSNPTVFRDNSSIVNTMSDQTKPKYVSPEKIDRNSRSQPLRTLLRERNKLLFMIYTANNALDLNLTPTSQLLAFLLLKGISSSVSNIRKLLASGTKDGSEVGRKSLEWNNFAELFEREADDILETFYGFREEFSSVVSRGPSTMWGDDAQITAVLTDSCPVDQGLLKKTILRYLEEIRGAKSRGGSDIERKVLLHSHEVADILILDEFFENFIDVNTKYHEQKYFETLRSCPIEGLNNLLSQKLEFARSRITSVSTSNRPISIHA